jgi:CheY-like chemotaxis protein
MARIVICEPSVELRHLFAQMVARLGHVAAVYRDPRDALLRAEAMLVDVDEETAAADAADIQAQAPDLPVIVCSIYPREQRSGSLRAVAPLVKPFTRADLEKAIGEALRVRSGTIERCPQTPSAPTGANA